PGSSECWPAPRGTRARLGTLPPAVRGWPMPCDAGPRTRSLGPVDRVGIRSGYSFRPEPGGIGTPWGTPRPAARAVPGPAGNSPARSPVLPSNHVAVPAGNTHAPGLAAAPD